MTIEDEDFEDEDFEDEDQIIEEKEHEVLDYTNRPYQDVVDEIIDPMIGVLDK